LRFLTQSNCSVIENFEGVTVNELIDPTLVQNVPRKIGEVSPTV